MIYLKHSYYKFILSVLDFLMKPLYYNFIKILTPNIFSCVKKGFGQKGDGRYVLPIDELNKIKEPIILSFGVADDISFENDILVEIPRAKIYCFDPSINYLPEENEKIKFFNVGLAGSDKKAKNLLSLPSILKLINAPKSSKLYIKMDVEGWEWDFFKKINLTDYNIDIITAEFHIKTYNFYSIFLLPITIFKKYKILKKLTDNFYILHTHANNYRYTFFNSFIFPDFVELTLINKNLFTNQIKSDIDEFNVKNVKDKEDFQYPFLKNNS